MRNWIRRKRILRTFFVLICSLALACAAYGDTEKTHHTHASQHAAAPERHPSGGDAHPEHAQVPQHVITPGGHPTGGGQHFEQTKGSQHVPTPGGGPTAVGPAVQLQPQGGPETAAHTTTAPQPPAAPLTKEQLDEAYAQSQGFRSAEQYRKWQETGRVEIPAGVA